ncbi:MAG: ABC transporter ATP-binding protein, partial [Rubrivivax sp.]|nr:ABC transporter ATP-binding protein [Rubrivivax sp.]
LRRIHEEVGTSFLVVTHDPRLAGRCDRIVEIVDGRIASDRSHPPDRSRAASTAPVRTVGS